MKSAFSLLELIFAIVILGIVASFAVPKYLDTKDSALVSTLKRDISTAVSSIQSYYLLNQKIDKISDAMTVNSTNWTSTGTKISDKNECLSLEIKTADSRR
ncbi:MAG: prepilin-type N-terminal cleavage/methylation domain-containing protein [Aliarcobacter sp.]|nr:prepilin-type N-terminal cleavage/methylation domain-containing protein [Aliarcobacter sp.]